MVRPDGMVSLPLLNDIPAAGLTTDELREKVMAEANKFVEDSTATVVVKQINSRKVFITGNVSKPGLYPLDRTAECSSAHCDGWRTAGIRRGQENPRHAHRERNANHLSG